jgi:hypothetical protein
MLDRSDESSVIFNTEEDYYYNDMLNCIKDHSSFVPNILLCFTTGESWFSGGNSIFTKDSWETNGTFTLEMDNSDVIRTLYTDLSLEYENSLKDRYFSSSKDDNLFKNDTYINGNAHNEQSVIKEKNIIIGKHSNRSLNDTQDMLLSCGRRIEETKKNIDDYYILLKVHNTNIKQTFKGLNTSTYIPKYQKKFKYNDNLRDLSDQELNIDGAAPDDKEIYRYNRVFISMLNEFVCELKSKDAFQPNDWSKINSSSKIDYRSGEIYLVNKNDFHTQVKNC